MAKRFADTDKYKKRFIRTLPAAYKILWDYICLDCNHAGIWHVDFDIAQIYVGKDVSINKEDALKYFNESEERIVILNGGSKWLIVPFLEFQYGELNPCNKVHNSILMILEKEGIKGLVRPLQGSKDMDMDMDKDKDKDNNSKKPTLREVANYCKERKNTIDPVEFINYYEANGWVQGNSRKPIKDWKACIRTWEAKQNKINNIIKTATPKATMACYQKVT